MRVTLENSAMALLAAGALVAVGGDKAGLPAAREAGIFAALIAVVLWGVDMIIRRRAEIGTRYSSPTSPRFHVFQGWSAIAWGLSIAIFAGMLLGYAAIELTGARGAKAFLAERPEVLVVLAGIAVAAWGFGSASRATIRRGREEVPAGRIGDRIGGAVGAVAGLCVVAAGLLRMLAPDVFDAWKASVAQLLQNFARAVLD